jgi:hypothetical protein
MSNGWIKLHRQLLVWEWYDDINTSRLFIHLLLTANHKDKKWRGILIEKGSRLTSQIKLIDESGLTRQQLRTSLDRLKSTNDITIKTTAQHTVIYINNWESYQEDNQLANQQLTSVQPTTNQQLTTNNKVKNEKNVNKTKKEWVAPDNLNVKAWEEFEQHRKEINKALTNLSRTKAANQICGLSFEQQQETINKSISSKWAGLFPKEQTNAQQQAIKVNTRKPMRKPGE